MASAKSFGDFVIAHSILSAIDDRAKHRVRLVALSHLKALNSILPGKVPVTIVDSGEDRVPAVFDVKKCGALAAVRSALSLRRVFQGVLRDDREVLAFDMLGPRERFIAGRWPVIAPTIRSANIYVTYARFLADQEIKTTLGESRRLDANSSSTVGIFPESRLATKRLSPTTIDTILKVVARAGLTARVFVLAGDSVGAADCPAAVKIPRDFASLANAIRSVDAVISADSLPAHLADYFGRPVYVALRAKNEYWLPYTCFTEQHWGLFGDESHFSDSLENFSRTLREVRPTVGAN